MIAGQGKLRPATPLQWHINNLQLAGLSWGRIGDGMMNHHLTRTCRVLVVSVLVFWCSLVNSAASAPEALLQQFDAYPHVRQVAFSKQEVIDHEIGLGAIQKVSGQWRFKRSERLSGTLLRYSWQIVDGFTSAKMMEALLESVAQGEGASLLFACNGRSCGRGVQWANRVFHERVLYGREDLQMYRVYALQGEQTYRLVAYSAQRTEDRQYLHVELLRIAK